MNVLIVDDSRAMRLLVRRSLRQAGFRDLEVAEASNGREALAQIDRRKPDLILSDWNMPEVDGLELLRTLRYNNIHIKFGFVTVQGTPEMRERARQAGASFHISKPFLPEDFADAIVQGF